MRSFAVELARLARFVADSLGGVLFSIRPSDGSTYVSVAVALVALALIATCVPAIRAGRADPATLLRA